VQPAIIPGHTDMNQIARQRYSRRSYARRVERARAGFGRTVLWWAMSVVKRLSI
jgi:hypothetical protein